MDSILLSPDLTARLIAAAERSLRARREIILLAGHACGHLPGRRRRCRACAADWPCARTMESARSALDAVAALRALVAA